MSGESLKKREMRERAVITGATAGLGAEFARQLARDGYDVVLVARNAVALDETAKRLKAEHGVRVETISADLVTEAGVAVVAERLDDRERPVSLLVNNAGFGLPGSFERNAARAESDHLQIHVRAPMLLMHAVLPGMLERKQSRIINVSSVAAFLPRASYGAAKAWTVSFSRWANVHYGDRGVRVTALCPGFVRTEFHERMNASLQGIPSWMWLRTEPVVRSALRASAAGRSVVVPSVRYRVLLWASKLLPERMKFSAARRGR